MSELVEFLQARLKEDEAAANACAEVYPAPWEVLDRGYSATVKTAAPAFRIITHLTQDDDAPHSSGWLSDRLDHIARHDPARALREVEGKRIVLALHTYEWMGPDDAAGKGCEHDYEAWPCPTLRALAAVYADYREEWSCVEYG